MSGILFPVAIRTRPGLKVVVAGLEDPCRFFGGREISLAL
jgi:hypothetical protein